MGQKNRENKGEQYLGLMGLEANCKKQLFELIYLYRLWEEYLVKIKGLRFQIGYLPVVGGLVLRNNQDIEDGCVLARLLISATSEEQVDFLENFDLNRLAKMVTEFKKLLADIPDYDWAGWGLKIFVLVRYGDWRKSLFTLVYWFLFLFIFGSVLYFLVATDTGRDLAWQFLDVYSFIIKVLMILILIIALVFILAIVSFMYFEGRNKKK